MEVKKGFRRKMRIFYSFIRNSHWFRNKPHEKLVLYETNESFV